MAGVTHIGSVITKTRLTEEDVIDNKQCLWKQVYYGRELKAVARRSGISLGITFIAKLCIGLLAQYDPIVHKQLGKLVALQLTYEAFACCTSVVLSTKEDQTPVHIRTMDWALSFLSDITIEVIRTHPYVLNSMKH